MRDGDQRLDALALRARRKLRRTPFSDDDVHLMARRRHRDAARDRRDDLRHATAVPQPRRRRQADKRVAVGAEARAGHEVLVPADAGILPGRELIGDELPLEIDLERRVDRHHPPVPCDHGRVVHDAHRQEAHGVLAVEPTIERLGSLRERDDREPVELPFAVRHLAGLVELHQARREELAVDAVVAPGTRGERFGDDRRDRPDPRLQRAALADVTQRVLCHPPLRLGRGDLPILDRIPGRFDEHVDLVDVDAVRMLGREPHGPRQERVREHDQQPFGIARVAMQLVGLLGGDQPEAHPSAVVGRRGAGHEHARIHAPHGPREAAEVAGNELHVVPAVAQRALGRAHEDATEVDVRLGEELERLGEQPAVDDEILPVVADREHFEQRRRLGGTEPERERIARAKEVDRVGEREESWRHGRAGLQHPPCQPLDGRFSCAVPMRRSRPIGSVPRMGIAGTAATRRAPPKQSRSRSSRTCGMGSRRKGGLRWRAA